MKCILEINCEGKFKQALVLQAFFFKIQESPQTLTGLKRLK